jgi:hypothetical protein
MSATGAPQPPAGPNRRKFYRRSKPFQGVYYTPPGLRVPLVGLNLSGGGMCVLFQQPFAERSPELKVGAVVHTEAFTMNGVVRWGDVVKIKGVDHFRYGLKLTSISDADWDRLMHWTIENNTDFVEGSTLSAAQRDALVTEWTQEKIAKELLARGRVDPYPAGQLPLIEYVFVRYTMRAGTPYVWLRVRSRCTDAKLRTTIDRITNVLVACNDGHLKILEAG